MQKTTMCLVLTLVCCFARAEENAAAPDGNKVRPLALLLSYSGRVELRVPGSSNWEPIAEGAWLFKNDRVRAFFGSQAHCLLNDNTVLRVGSNYSHVVGRREDRSSPPDSKFWRALVASETGSWESILPRNDAFPPPETGTIRALLPLNDDLVERDFALRWQGGVTGRPYHVTVEKDTGEVVWTGESRDTYLLVSTESSLRRGRTYYWSVSQEEGSDLRRAMGQFRIMKRVDADRRRAAIRKSLAALNVDVDLPALHLATGLMYAEEGLCIEADRELHSAVSLSPDNEIYSLILDTFYAILAEKSPL